jgi:hypothetical protein
MIEDVLSAVATGPVATLEDVLAADRAAREEAARWLSRRASRQARERRRMAGPHGG